MAAASLPCLRVLDFGAPVRSVDWSPDGTRIAVGDGKGVEVLTTEGRRLWRHDVGSGSRSHRWSPDGHRLAAAESAAVVIRHAQSGDVALTIPIGHVIHALSWSPNGERLACTGGGHLIGTQTGALTSNVIEATDSVAWSSEPDLIATHKSRKILIWDVRAGDRIATLDAHASFVLFLCWSHKGERLASASDDGTVRLWHVVRRRASFQVEAHSVVHEKAAGHSAAWSPDDSALASGSKDQTVCIWSPETGDELARLAGHTGTVFSVAFSPDGTRLASASADKTVRIWDVSTLSLGSAERAASPSVEAFVARQAASVGRRARRTVASLWVPRLPSDSEASLATFRVAEGSKRTSVDLLPDGFTLLIGAGDGSVRALDLATGSTIWHRQFKNGGVYDLQVSPNGALVAIAGYSKPYQVHVVDALEGKYISTYRHHRDSIFSVAWSYDSELVASTSPTDKSIHLWVASTGKLIRQSAPHDSGVRSISWQPQGRLMASSTGGGELGVWSPRRGESLQRNKLGRTSGWGVAWSPDGERIALSSSNAIVIWRLTDRREVARTVTRRTSFNCVSWSPNGRLLASGGGVRDAAIRLWNPATGDEVHRFSPEENFVWRLAWAPSGAFLAAGLDSGVVRIYDTREFVDPERHTIQAADVLTPLTPGLEPLPNAFAHLLRLGLPAPLSHLRSLLGSLTTATDDQTPAPLADHPHLRQLAALRWPAATRPGLAALLLRDVPRDPRWTPPPDVTPTALRDALADALTGEPMPPEAPPLPVAALTNAADALDERLLTLLELVGPEAVAADPGLPLRLLPQAPRLPALSAPARRLLGLRLRLDQGGPSQGSGAGAERTGIDLRGDIRSLLPSQLALPWDVLRARHLRGDLLYRARSGQEPPRLRPTVLVLDVSPPTFGPIEATTRLAAHIVAATLIEAGIPAVLVTAGGDGSVQVLERPADLVAIWTERSHQAADEARALHVARAMRETLADGALEPVVLLLSHVYFAADATPPTVPSLRGLFVDYPGRHQVRPALAGACQRWERVAPGEADGLGERLGRLVG